VLSDVEYVVVFDVLYQLKRININFFIKKKKKRPPHDYILENYLFLEQHLLWSQA